jgi:hypothetical protein
MNPAMLLMGVYVLVTFALQLIFFMISRFVDQIAPDWSLLVFLVLFLCAYGFAWPVAVHLTEPETVEGALRDDLLTLQHEGLIRSFSVEHRKDGPFVQVYPGENCPPDLRSELIEALGRNVAETRISVAT